MSAWQHDHAASTGAALSYYSAFSLAPLLLIVIAIAGLIFGGEAAQREIVGQVGWLIGEQGATAAQVLLNTAHDPIPSLLATLIGFASLMIGATGVFAALQTDMDRIWRAPIRQSSGFVHVLRTRLLSFGVILALTFLMLFSLVISAGLAAAGRWWGRAFRGEVLILESTNFVCPLWSSRCCSQ